MSFNVGDRVLFVGNNKPMRVLRVGMSEDNRGRKKPAVWAATEEDIEKEKRGERDPDWGTPFKASVYPYLFEEIRKL